MKFVRFLCISFVALSLFGCQTWSLPPDPPAETILKANYGGYPNDYQKDIMNYMTNYLKDPSTALYKFSKPTKAYLLLSNQNEPIYGYVVYADINAKNSYGGYTGYQRYVYIVNQQQNLVVSIGDLLKAKAVKLVKVD